MLRKVLPRGVRSHLRGEFHRLLAADLPATLQDTCVASMHQAVDDKLRADLPWQVRRTFQEHLLDIWPAPDGYAPHADRRPCVVQECQPEPGPTDDEHGLPIPPARLWAGYGVCPDTYLRSGKADVQNMEEIAAAAGGGLRPAGRVLELGCSAGRLTRWLYPLTREADGARCEVWGVDITAEHIHWCQQYLNPPFHFATTTLHPHLPFEDHSFGFAYAGSVFTHLGDLADAWFLELRRVLRPGGQLYVTLQDKHTVDLLRREPWHPLAKHLATVPDWEAVSRSDFGVLTVGGEDWTRRYTFHDVDFLCRRLGPFFAPLSVTPEAYGYQTALLLERQ